MDGASDVPPATGDDGTNIPPMPNDQGGADMQDMGAGDPSMDDGMAPGGDMPNGNPGNMGDEGMEDLGNDMGGDAEGDDSTMSIINQLSDTDREAVRAYAESMLNREETPGGEGDEIEGPDGGMLDDGGMSDPNGAPENGGVPTQNSPMMETFQFTKGQLLSINEKLGPKSSKSVDDDSKPLTKKNTSKTVSAKSPFSPKKFK